jgi:hypothetical protein
MDAAPRAPAALRALMQGAIDYAGLFPPAQLDMPAAVEAYASYLRSADAWALGRFVVPAARLDEFEAAANGIAGPRGERQSAVPAERWRLSVLAGADVSADMARARAFGERLLEDSSAPWTASVEAVEVRAATPDAVAGASAAAGRGVECYIEIPIAGDPAPLVRAISEAGARAKVRTGGTTEDAFPSSADLLRFLAACVAEGVAFKATAGLHHPLRGSYALTYLLGSARGTMFGFLNVFLATAFLRAGAGEDAARAVLEERAPESVTFGDEGVEWRGRVLARAELVAARELAITSFGSCSFREPLDDLAALRML